jgi:hypothetical protein
VEPWKTFIGRIMRQLNIRKRVSTRALPLNVELERWGDNVNKVTPVDLQQKVQERT